MHFGLLFHKIFLHIQPDLSRASVYNKYMSSHVQSTKIRYVGHQCFKITIRFDRKKLDDFLFLLIDLCCLAAADLLTKFKIPDLRNSQKM